MNKYLSDVVIVVFMIIIAFLCVTSLMPAQPTNPVEKQYFEKQISDEEYLRIGIDGYLTSKFNSNFPKPDYDVVLEDRAVENAARGENLWLSVSGNTTEESLKTLIALDTSTYSCDMYSFWIMTNKRDNPGTKYAIGVYKTTYNQYNVSIVIEKPQVDTQELNRNGAWMTVHHNPTISNFSTYCHQRYTRRDS